MEHPLLEYQRISQYPILNHYWPVLTHCQIIHAIHYGYY